MSDFRHRAACRDLDPEQFFPVGTGPATDRQVAVAKQVCRRCPVRTPCLEWALHTGQDDGVWGGLDPTERRRERWTARSGQPARSPVLYG